ITFGQVARGVVPVEAAMGGADFVAQARRRGFAVEVKVR
ncbi:MAG: hypothetical protein HW375_831, partial [Anaerolineales bacterium]|nr:hypothetical protein [Anaerolineales bacterium]